MSLRVHDLVQAGDRFQRAIRLRDADNRHVTLRQGSGPATRP
jgi:hypothetical protein